ncbi:membrane protein [Paraburkholderia caffeinilytica]|uniref:Lipoprotein transmembrane n=1 Tax=Paraburkholderia caffeinilytica TaxID=1761016 RepID=A0ABQ1MST4_9BURK|nr:hypothetical protein [Paraburkholderia caffeinilytica]AXL49553.1 membrane protein [Paraburkholderia caffeinilytica]GGC46133.1 hypothetical protein GCM10011400_36540 [Paraburkholderia caffeinilytica]CAB3783855.1 hypothetical protein LMG28690_01680 [Paraburkholderia caffeinilytica]
MKRLNRRPEQGSAPAHKRRTFLTAAAGLGALLAVATPAAHAASSGSRTGKKIVMIVQLNGPNLAVDQKIAARLDARGYSVRMLDQAQPPEAVGDAELVVISSTVSSKQVAGGWRYLAKPLLTWENDLLDDFAMTGKRHDVDFGEAEKERYLWLVNAPHPIAAGLPAGVANVYVKQAPMSWGKPGLGATTIATLYGQPEKAAIFAYEKGATMDYESLAPARRVMLFLNNDTFANLSPAGNSLFDAAVDWAVGLS